MFYDQNRLQFNRDDSDEHDTVMCTMSLMSCHHDSPLSLILYLAWKAPIVIRPVIAEY